MRKIRIAPDEYYHIFNRGNNKQNIFLDKRDWIRFLFLILYFQSPLTFSNLGRSITYFVRRRAFNISADTIKEILENRYVELVSFVLMPNHFHLIIKELKEGGISQYMQRIQTAFAKYFNTKYKKSGHLFQGPFKIVRIESNEQLLHLSAYIHRNPREIKQWKNREKDYFWSSYQDYIGKNRWGELLKNDIILEQFSNSKDYKKFVDTSGTKLYLDEEFLIE